MVETRSPAPPSQLAKELSLLAFAADQGELEKLCMQAIEALPIEADIIRNGNLRVLNKLVGHVMKATRGRADALAVAKRLREILSV